MNREPTLLDALLGALGLVVLGILAPLGLNLGGVGLALWLLPLIAVHLWPRDANVGLSCLLILVLGTALDMALGLRLGTYPLLALTWYWLIRPDLRTDPFHELGSWLLFALGIALVLALIAGVNRSLATLVDLLPDALVAIPVFPLVLRAYRVSGRSDLAAAD